jgi:hypothetical protein
MYKGGIRKVEHISTKHSVPHHVFIIMTANIICRSYGIHCNGYMSSYTATAITRVIYCKNRVTCYIHVHTNKSSLTAVGIEDALCRSCRFFMRKFGASRGQLWSGFVSTKRRTSPVRLPVRLQKQIAVLCMPMQFKRQNT